MRRLGRYHHPPMVAAPIRISRGMARSFPTEKDFIAFSLRPVPYPGRTLTSTSRSPGAGSTVSHKCMSRRTLNDRDFVLSRIRDPAARERVVVQLEPADAVEAGALLGRFDIVVGGA